MYLGSGVSTELLGLRTLRMLTGLWKVSKVWHPDSGALQGSNGSREAGLGGLCQGALWVRPFGRGLGETKRWI